MDFLSSGGRVADGDVNSKSFECMRVKRRPHRVARTHLTCGLSSRVCADGHTVNVPPRSGFDTRELPKLEKELRFNKSLSRARRAEVAGALQLGETQVNVWFQKRRMKQKMTERAGAHTRGTGTQSGHLHRSWTWSSAPEYVF